MVDEMIKFREMLTQLKIEWNDASELKESALHIDRTHFWYRDYNWSVINGFGTYGGCNVFRDGKNQGLLELMSNAVNGGEPVGYLTAEEAMKLILEAKNEQDSARDIKRD